VGAVVAVVTDCARALTGDVALGGATGAVADLRTTILALAHTFAAGCAYIKVLVNTALTVVIHTVTPLFGVGIDGRIAVITVGIQRGVIGIGGRAFAFAVATLTIPIVVVVFVIGGATLSAILVVYVVAVVVKVVALLGITRIGVLVAVITVTTLGGRVRIAAGAQALGVAVYTIGVAVGILIEGAATGGVFFVNGAVAVIVLAVATLRTLSHLTHAATKAAAATGLGTRMANTHIQGTRRTRVAGLCKAVVGVAATRCIRATVIGADIAVVTVIFAAIKARKAL
jgi:hypothetical protein